MPEDNINKPDIPAMLNEAIELFKEDLRKKGYSDEETVQMVEAELSQKWVYA